MKWCPSNSLCNSWHTVGAFFFKLAALGLGCHVQDLHCVMQDLLVEQGLSSYGPWVPEHTGSVIVAQGLSCSLACRILVSWPGIEPESPGLQGRFLTTGPPGKSWCGFFSCGMRTFSYGMRDLVLWRGIKPGPPAWEMPNIRHWTNQGSPQ